MSVWNGLKRTPLKARKSLSMVSPKQRAKNALWKRITDTKAESLWYICQWCGRPGQRVSPELPEFLDGHHIIKRRFNINTPENCFIAHRLCHDFIELHNIDVSVYSNKESWLKAQNVIKPY